MVGKRPSIYAPPPEFLLVDDSSSDEEPRVRRGIPAKRAAGRSGTGASVRLPIKAELTSPTRGIVSISSRTVTLAPAARPSPFAQKNSAAKSNKSPLFASQSIFHDVISSQEDAGKESFSDVQLVCGISKTVFHCHRVILAPKSDTFQRMFANGSGFAEGKTGQVVIDDVSAGVMEDLLRFIYCGYVNADLDAASADLENELMYAATKYNVKELVDLIMLAVKHKLTAATACRYLLLADYFSLKDLKQACCQEISRSPASRAEAVQSAEWADVSSKPDLFKEFVLFHATSPYYPIGSMMPNVVVL